MRNVGDILMGVPAGIDCVPSLRQSHFVIEDKSAMIELKEIRTDSIGYRGIRNDRNFSF